VLLVHSRALDLEDVRKPCPLLFILIRRNDLTVIYLLEIHRWVDIEELAQPVEHLFTQNLSLLIEAFLVFPDREADDGVLAHEEVLRAWRCWG